MLVEILANGTVIGTGELKSLDPPMGAASGPFTPSSAYNRAIHAGEIGGRTNEAGWKAGLSLRRPEGDLQCVSVWIHDCEAELGEIELSVSGMTGFDTYFRDHPHYRSYWGLDLTEDERLARNQAIEEKLRARDIRSWIWILGALIGLALLLTWIM